MQMGFSFDDPAAKGAADIQPQSVDVAIVGAGPAGLMAAEKLSALGHSVTIFDAMATPGRKFLMAGRGGLNLTHSEPIPAFLRRYGPEEQRFQRFLSLFSPSDLRLWADGLDAVTFIGSSGRIFPKAMKASGLLRAWLTRLANQRVTLQTRHIWQGWHGDDLVFQLDDGSKRLIRPKTTVLALGGASWPKLGSDGAWQEILSKIGVTVSPLTASNCGAEIAWSVYFQEHFAGEPLKSITVAVGDQRRHGEIMLTRYGVEGGPVYALSAALRRSLQLDDQTSLIIDLKPDQTVEQLAQRLATRRHGQSLSQFLKKTLHLPAPSYALLREATADVIPEEAHVLAQRLKALRLRVISQRPIDQAISSAGGISFEALDDELMLRNRPGVFACGEMLDWEAPTGGYLLQGCFSTAVAAAMGADHYLRQKKSAG